MKILNTDQEILRVIVGEDLTHKNFNSLNLSGAVFCDKSLDCVEVVNSSLHKSLFPRTSCLGANFSGSDLTLANFIGADLRGAIFSEDSIINRAAFTSAILLGADFSSIGKIENVDFSLSHAQEVVFRGCALRQNRFSGAILDRADFSNTFIHAGNFHAAGLYNASFKNATIQGGYFNGADCEKANFSDANFGGIKTYFGSANISNANFSGANLAKTDLTEIQLDLRHSIYDASTIF